jgi:TPR repeat protein
VTAGEQDRIYDRGVAAANRGEFAIAVRLWRHAAEQGHAKAQYNLGVAYSRGIGAPQDKAAALKWWRLASKQGHTEAERQAELLRARSFVVDRLLANLAAAIALPVKAAVEWLRQVAGTDKRD